MAYTIERLFRMRVIGQEHRGNKTSVLLLGCKIEHHRVRASHCCSGQQQRWARCELERTYTILSYAWGHTCHDRPILLDDTQGQIRENLWMTLIYLRLKTGRLVLWIDALYTNQLDTSERNHLVAQMSRIYSAAEWVVAWLGLQTEESHSGRDFLHSLVSVQSTPTALKNSSTSTDSLLLFKDLCQRPYWNGLWIIQEVVRAAHITVQCGTAFIDRESLSSRLELADREILGNVIFNNGLLWLLNIIQHRKKYYQSGYDFFPMYWSMR